MTEIRIKDIIARLAQPDPLPDLAPLCPDRKELTRILLDIRKGVRSPFYADLREEAGRQHLDVHHLVQKAEFLLTSLNISSSTDYYSVLDLDQDASAEEIHEKWIEKVRMYHPDNYEDPTGWIAQQCWRLNEAYAVLKNPEKRRAYDDQRRAGMRGAFGAPGGSTSISSLGEVDSTLAAGSRSRLTRAIALGAIAIAGLIVGVLLWSR